MKVYNFLDKSKGSLQLLQWVDGLWAWSLTDKHFQLTVGKIIRNLIDINLIQIIDNNR